MKMGGGDVSTNGVRVIDPAHISATEGLAPSGEKRGVSRTGAVRGQPQRVDAAGRGARQDVEAEAPRQIARDLAHQVAQHARLVRAQRRRTR